MTIFDKTYCVSPQCKNECGRQLTTDVLLKFFVSDRLMKQAYFCGEPENEKAPDDDEAF